ncbi:MAG: CDP-glucose 4,6-dehydratase [Fluviibacter phosphoraccumulans EoVTN8]
MSPDFWSGKRVLVTGHTGFKGSWISIWLQSLGADLKGLALDPPTSPSLFVEANVAAGMESQIGDVRNFDTVLKCLDDFGPEIIIHMAAQPLVRYSYKFPIETYATNVMGTVHLLEATRLTGTAKVVVNVTTDKCYENKEWLWGYREEEPMGGFDPYSSSKGCSELVTSAFRRSYFFNSQIAVASARAGNVIGGGDWAEDRLIPDVLRAFDKEETAVIRNPDAVRPWQHVLEPLSGYLILAERLWDAPEKYAEGWNFGPNDEDAKSVGYIVEKLCSAWGDEKRWRSNSGEHPHEANYLKLDISKAHQKLGWSPTWSLDTALDKIIEWHKGWLEGSCVRTLCVKQLNEYIVESKKT